MKIKSTLAKRMSESPKRPVVRRQYSNEQMLGAIKSIEGGMSWTAAAERHGVPLSTLRDHFNGKVIHETNPGPPGLIFPKMKKVNLPLFYWNVLTLATESQGEMSSVLLSHTC